MARSRLRAESSPLSPQSMQMESFKESPHDAPARGFKSAPRLWGVDLGGPEPVPDPLPASIGALRARAGPSDSEPWPPHCGRGPRPRLWG